MGIISYAQNYEDVMLWRALGGIEKGFYIDVGAYSPDVDSVTRLFYEKGWRGVNLEPHLGFLAQLTERRPHDINLGLAVSDHTGEAEFHSIEDTGLSTLAPEIARRTVKKGRSDEVFQVPVTTLTDIWNHHVPDSQPVHFLKIDVEGAEERVIRGADWKRHRPWIVLAESTVPESTEQNHHGWDPLLLEAGYDFVWFDGLNRFYVAREHADLAQAFTAPPNFFDHFRRAEEVAFEARAQIAEARLIGEQSSLATLGSEIASLRQAFEAQAQAQTAETRLIDEQSGLATLGFEIASLRQTFEVERDQRAALFISLRHFLQQVEWSRKPLWTKLLFRPSGKPKKLLRRMLFHNSGKPRGVFRSLVLRPDGRPHSPFLEWMLSSEYQSQRAAVQLSGQAWSDAGWLYDKATTASATLSPDAVRVAQRISALHHVYANRD